MVILATLPAPADIVHPGMFPFLAPQEIPPRTGQPAQLTVTGVDGKTYTVTLDSDWLAFFSNVQPGTLVLGCVSANIEKNGYKLWYAVSAGSAFSTQVWQDAVNIVAEFPEVFTTKIN